MSSTITRVVHLPYYTSSYTDGYVRSFPLRIPSMVKKITFHPPFLTVAPEENTDDHGYNRANFGIAMPWWITTSMIDGISPVGAQNRIIAQDSAPAFIYPASPISFEYPNGKTIDGNYEFRIHNTINQADIPFKTVYWGLAMLIEFELM